ncbi:MAG: diphthine synthase [Nanoarchaeota archaeon]|nr:diphthine synthase [Nanoarchaeota archaeon]MBU0963334.1 diphthine synthase [Nanoarchaeota archaeon]
MLNIIGIGLSHKNITEEIKEIVKKSDYAYFENYTSKYNISVNELEILLDKKLIVANRSLVENSNEILENSKTENVSLLIIGDIFMATTHTAIYLEAKKLNIDIKLIHNVSILNLVSDSGLSLYNFGKITSIPFNNENIEEPFKIFEENKKMNLHTLFLLDLDPENDKYMTINQALNYLLRKVKDEEYAIACSALGTDNQEIRYDKMKNLINLKFDKYPQCIVIPGKLHFIEQEILETIKNEK